MKKNVMLAASMVACLGACQSMVETRRDVRDSNDDALQRVESLLQSRQRTQPVVGPVVTDVPYVDVRPIARGGQYPPTFQRTVTLNESAGVSMLELAARVQTLFGVRMVYEHEINGSAGSLGSALPSVPSGPMPQLAGGLDAVLSGAPPLSVPAPLAVPRLGVPLKFNGNAVQLFNTIGSETNSHWEYNEGTRVVHFFRFKTETFRVPAIPGRSMGNSAMGGLAQGSEGTPISQSFAGSTHETSAQVWDEIKETIEGMLSSEGKLTVSQTAGTLTVRDRVDRLETIRSYMQDTADALARQVDIDVTVYRVVINDADQRAVNWNLAFRNMLGHYLIGADTTAGRPDVVAGGLASMVIGVPERDSNGVLNRWGSSQAILDTLSTMGRASVETSTSVQTANNQPAPMKIVKRRSYLESVSQNMNGSGNDLVSTGPTLTPGVVETGLNIFALPHVQDDGKRMLLKMMVSLTSLESMDTYGNDQAMIQLPQIAAREFERQVWLNSGETLVLAGFEQTDSSETTASPVDRRWWGIGGNSRVSKEREFVVIAIHPSVTAVRSRI